MVQCVGRVVALLRWRKSWSDVAAPNPAQLRMVVGHSKRPKTKRVPDAFNTEASPVETATPRVHLHPEWFYCLAEMGYCTNLLSGLVQLLAFCASLD